MNLRLILVFFLALSGCTKKPIAPGVHFVPGELHLDRAKIEALPPDQVWGEALNIVRKAIEGKHAEDSDEVAKALPQPWRAVSNASDLEGEVYNGGFHQYFFNSRCKLLYETRDDLRFLGATEFVNIYEKAIAGIDVRYYTSPDRNDDDWEKFTAKYADYSWDDLEKRFYNAKKTLQAYVGEYIKAHPDQYQ